MSTRRSKWGKPVIYVTVSSRAYPELNRDHALNKLARAKENFELLTHGDKYAYTDSLVKDYIKAPDLARNVGRPDERSPRYNWGYIAGVWVCNGVSRG